MTPSQQAALEQVASDWWMGMIDKLDPSDLPPAGTVARHLAIGELLMGDLAKLLATQRAAVLEEMVKIGQDFINTVYLNSPSHAKGATEILELLRQQAQEQRP